VHVVKRGFMQAGDDGEPAYAPRARPVRYNWLSWATLFSIDLVCLYFPRKIYASARGKIYCDEEIGGGLFDACSIASG
jgi:hypothetical protein